MMKKSKIDFYKKLAKEIKPQGFRCFLYDEGTSAWLYIITPRNSWLYVDGDINGFNVIYQYTPSRSLGSGCRYNNEGLCEITADTLNKAEQYGIFYTQYRWKDVPNTYDGGSHKEHVWTSPVHYEDGYKAMMNSWCADRLVEI